MLLHCDLVAAGESARLQMPFVHQRCSVWQRMTRIGFRRMRRLRLMSKGN